MRNEVERNCGLCWQEGSITVALKKLGGIYICPGCTFTNADYPFKFLKPGKEKSKYQVKFSNMGGLWRDIYLTKYQLKEAKEYSWKIRNGHNNRKNVDEWS